MNRDDDGRKRHIHVDHPSLDALIRVCLGLRAGLYGVRHAGSGAALGPDAEPMPDFEDTMPASHARLRRVDD